MEIYKIKLKDCSNLDMSLLQLQACLSGNDFSNEIVHLRGNQRINNESIQSLSDSIVQIFSTISKMQGNNNMSYVDILQGNPQSHRSSSNSPDHLINPVTKLKLKKFPEQIHQLQ